MASKKAVASVPIFRRVVMYRHDVYLKKNERRQGKRVSSTTVFCFAVKLMFHLVTVPKSYNTKVELTWRLVELESKQRQMRFKFSTATQSKVTLPIHVPVNS